MEAEEVDLQNARAGLKLRESVRACRAPRNGSLTDVETLLEASPYYARPVRFLIRGSFEHRILRVFL